MAQIGLQCQFKKFKNTLLIVYPMLGTGKLQPLENKHIAQHKKVVMQNTFMYAFIPLHRSLFLSVT